MLKTLPFCAGLVLVTAAASADGLDPQIVPGDVGWLIHVDVERLVQSNLGRHILEHGEIGDIDFDFIEEMKEEVGIDPVEDIYSMTMHGQGDPDEDLTLELLMSDEIDAVIEAASGEEPYRRLDVHGHVVHRWDEGEPTYVHVRKTADPERRLVVLSGRKRRVADVIQVLEDETPSLEDVLGEDESSSSITALPRSGSLIFAFATGMPWIEEDEQPASAIVRRSNRMMMELREREKMTSLDLAISAKSRRDARNIRDVLRGLIALGEMVSDTEPDLDELGEVLRAIDIDSRGNEIRIRIELDSREFVEHVGNMSEHM